MQRKPTMNDVARLAGVGTMTVSRVLNGTAKVSEEAAKSVKKAIAQLNYQPNELARALRGQRTRSIGLILPYLYDPFFAMCAHAVTSVARQHGYSVLTTTSNEAPEIEVSEAAQMLQRNVEGLIVIPANSGPSLLTRAMLGKTPLVCFDRPLADPSYDSVLVQNQHGARRLVEHLIEHGHTAISFLGLSRQLYTIHARLQGYRKAMSDTGLEPTALFTCQTPESTLDAVSALLRQPQPPTAIFTANNLVTRYVFSALLQLGIKIPTDVALAGFDDFEMAELASPPLTVVRQPALEIGRVAAGQLFERLERDETQQTGSRIVLPVELVLRRSCGCRHKTAVVIH